MAKQYIYRGPAAVIQVDGKLIRQGDKINLDDVQFRQLATLPYGSGIHIFQTTDGKDLPGSEPLPSAQKDNPLWAQATLPGVAPEPVPVEQPKVSNSK